MTGIALDQSSSRTGGWRPYVALSSLVVALMVIHTMNRQWSSDVWDHAAVVKEFSRSLVAPRHPHLGSASPHPFMTPTSWVVGVLARATGVFVALQIAALVNLGLFLVGLWMFARRVVAGPLAPALALLLTLLWWGFRPWRYSGFYHLNALGFGLPYPSVSAMALALIALSLFIDWQRGGAKWTLLAVTGLGSVVLVTHPIAYVFLIVGVSSFALSHRGALVGAATVALGSVAIGAAWPFYPVFELAQSVDAEVHRSNHAMYEAPLLRVLPVCALGVVAFRERRRLVGLDPLLVVVGALLVVYAYGALTSSWSWGRVISPCVLVVHLVTAEWLASRVGVLRTSWIARAGSAAVVLVCLANLTPGIARVVPRQLLPAFLAQRPDLAPVDEAFAFLGDHLSDGDVVIADLSVARKVAAFGGRTVALDRRFPFVDAHEDRQSDVRRFAAEPASRPGIAAKYGATWALFPVDVAVQGRAVAVRGNLVLTNIESERFDRWQREGELTKQ